MIKFIPITTNKITKRYNVIHIKSLEPAENGVTGMKRTKITFIDNTTIVANGSVKDIEESITFEK